jgi:hypothetical protein
MRKLVLRPSLSPLRLTLLGLAVVTTVLSLLPAEAEIVFTESGCLQYCEDWHWSDGCCFVSGSYKQRQERTCTNGVGGWCTEYRCTTGLCAI